MFAVKLQFQKWLYYQIWADLVLVRIVTDYIKYKFGNRAIDRDRRAFQPNDSNKLYRQTRFTVCGKIFNRIHSIDTFE